MRNDIRNLNPHLANSICRCVTVIFVGVTILVFVWPRGNAMDFSDTSLAVGYTLCWFFIGV